ncbi:MAG TPA: universal stress protein, partial [Thermomicrobiales bacterium]|nr:universal stress protein [Thermomicrobiales bacterium]
AAAIAAAARDHGVAVVAMATHDRAGAERHPQGGTHLGSGAADALRRCAVPVLLVRPPALRLAPEAGAPA